MKYLVVMCCVLAAVMAQKYTDKYDNIDLNEALTNKRLFDGYTGCILETGKCTPEAKELRDHLREAIETGCEKCTKKQEEGATTVIDFLIKNKIEIWRELADKYDPERKWRKKYEDRARANGIVIPE